MANSLTGFVDTLTQAVTEASAQLVGPTALIDSVYKKYETRPGAGVMSIPRPTFNGFAEVGNGTLTYTDVNDNAAVLRYNKRPAGGIVITDLEQYQSATDIRDGFLDGMFKNGLEWINGQIAALFNATNAPTNFPSHGATTNDVDTTGSMITVSQFLAARTILGKEKAPVDDPSGMTLVVPDQIHNKMLDSSTTAGAAWTAATSTGDAFAGAARSAGQFPVAYGTRIRREGQVPVTGAAGSQVWNCLYFHKFAIGLGLRPLPAPDGKVVEWGYVDVKGVPMRWMIGYDQDRGGHKVSVDYGYALGVVREALGVVIKVTEA